ncbi:endospore germination permease [Paenibacillus sp. BK720]|uniref:GerAB/ArcD/ProY family transporter n=1 Tax=Paenibacillus sp. BK720 TaxID=2587092 RepID=UPI0014221761|nr:endospore germination permease [Paenibacillus sp. BK720]NIK66618.1 spore germination protein KB [Paenibacillus sp. BK720]
MDHGKITSFQVSLLMYSVILATGFITIPGISAHYAMNDFWLAPIVAIAAGGIVLAISIKLHRLYPDKNLIQYSERIIGKVPGKILGLIYCQFFVFTGGIVCREYAEFVTGNFLFKTPMFCLVILMVLLAAFAVRGGVELVVRSTLLLTPLFILPLFFLLLLIPDFEISNILPFMSHGMIPVIQGSLAPISWYSEFLIIAFFLPSVIDKNKTVKYSILSLLAVSASLTYVCLVSLFVLGSDTADKVYPVLTAFRYISRADFFENLEALLLAMWVVGNFIKIAAVYYAAVLSFTSCFNLKDYKPFVFPIGMLIVIHCFWDFPSFFKLSGFLHSTGLFHLSTFMLVIPILLLIIALCRKQWSKLIT